MLARAMRASAVRATAELVLLATPAVSPNHEERAELEQIDFED
jgi:hypothetical protein